MLSYRLLTLVLAAATRATPTPSNTTESLRAMHNEAIIPYEDYEAEIASAGANGLRAHAEERICDLTLCSGVNLSGDCSRWCFYRNEAQRVPTKERLRTRSAHYERPIECWFYSAPTCDQTFLLYAPIQKMTRPGGNLQDHVVGQAGCVLCVASPDA
ncbi:hypothetical protein LY78DRAFT_677871 [Colletotrichum sublineola]|uniref:Uncharacterized protein n=1 Tax=Colletotrichum sublineola TaxID=1173701 RepID=A0A066XPY2_COLSU|nr:hypothetical protein LY78DRAFT_677871 [Colletotrichum sublineola]KDN71268.1 hypothetical protein CSUB01_08655 [Colletotrichum sublineola]